jgi:hypothetical protein
LLPNTVFHNHYAGRPKKFGGLYCTTFPGEKHMPEDFDFAGLEFGGNEGDCLVKPNTLPYLQWFNGLTTTSNEIAIGFHLQADVHGPLDETLSAMGTKRYIVQHKSTSQNGEAKQLPYWALYWGTQPCSLFILSYGIKSKSEMNKNATDRCGIAYGWETIRDRQGNIVKKKGSDEPKIQCRLQFRAYIHELVRNGFSEWFQVPFSGMITDHVLVALNEQFRVLDVYNTYARSKGFKNAPYFGFSLPILPGARKMVGPKDGDKAPIYPPLAQVPEQIKADYLVEHRIPEDLHQRILDEKILEDAVVWSMQRSQEITEEPTLTITEEEPVTTKAVELVEPEPDRSVNEKELAWIINGYCMGNRMFIKQTCDRFGVTDPTQLLLSHYHILQTESASYTQPNQ